MHMEARIKALTITRVSHAYSKHVYVYMPYLGIELIKTTFRIYKR